MWTLKYILKSFLKLKGKIKKVYVSFHVKIETQYSVLVSTKYL